MAAGQADPNWSAPPSVAAKADGPRPFPPAGPRASGARQKTGVPQGSGSPSARFARAKSFRRFKRRAPERGQEKTPPELVAREGSKFGPMHPWRLQGRSSASSGRADALQAEPACGRHGLSVQAVHSLPSFFSSRGLLRTRDAASTLVLSTCQQRPHKKKFNGAQATAVA